MTEVRGEISKLGARITQQYSVLGEYDFVTFIEAPDNAAIAKDRRRVLRARHDAQHDDARAWHRQVPEAAEAAAVPHGAARVADVVVGEPRAPRGPAVDRRPSRQAYVRPLTIEGRENLDGFKGPAIVIGNHSSHFDSPVILTALPGRISNKILAAAAADKFFPLRRKRHWWYSLFAGAFPVHRGGGSKQLDYPMSLFKKGWSILIFPEGGRSKSGQIAKFKAGPAMMAMGCKVPVIPVYMEGLRAIMPKGNRYPTPGPATARIGKPISVEGAASIREATEMLENALRELAGQPLHHHPVPDAKPVEVEAVAASAGGGALACASSTACAARSIEARTKRRWRRRSGRTPTASTRDQDHRRPPQRAQRGTAARSAAGTASARRSRGTIEVRPLTPAMREEYLAYFDGPAFCDNPVWARCYCLSYHIDLPPGPDFDERSGVLNRAERAAQIDRGEASGVLAFPSGRIVGWCNASPRQHAARSR